MHGCPKQGHDPLWDSMDGKIMIPSGENPELSKVPSVKPAAEQIIALHASPTAWNSVFIVSAVLAHSTLFFPILFQDVLMCFLNNSESDIYL